MKFLSKWLPSLFFKSSSQYWEQRYRLGGNSGAGSYGKAAEYKAAVLNKFVADNAIASVIEFGCGDGNQLTLATYPSYLGLDISATAVERCRQLFQGDASKRFEVVTRYAGQKAELALSLDVIYHLVEDETLYQYLDTLFSSGTRFVAIYSSDVDDTERKLPHVKMRQVSTIIAKRFPGFVRRADLEASFPPPVVVINGIETKFLIYEASA